VSGLEILQYDISRPDTIGSGEARSRGIDEDKLSKGMIARFYSR
jgi:hypothetical protein